MRLPPRIYVPALAAALTAFLVGLAFLWQIQSSVRVIESGFSLRNQKTTLTSAGTTRPRGTVAAGSQALVLLREGELLELKGQWEKAQQKYEQSVTNGGGITSLRKLADIQMQRRQFDDARRTIQSLRNSDGNREDATMMEGLLEMRSGNVSKAKSIFQGIAKFPQGQYGLALVAIAGGEHERATALLSEVSLAPNAEIQSSAKILLDAYREFSLFAYKRDEHMLTLVSRALAQVNECETALPLLTTVTTSSPSYRDAFLVKGYCELVTERTPQALASLESAYAIDSEKPEIQYFLARTYKAMNDTNNAITFLQYAIINGLKPERDARELLASYAIDANDTALALEQYAAIIDDDPKDIAASQTYVHLAIRIPGKSEDAYRAALALKNLLPNDPDALALLAEAAMASGKRSEASENAEAALRLDPKHAIAKEVIERLKLPQ